MLVGACADAAFVGLIGDGRNVIADFFGVKRIANVQGAHAGVEMRDEHERL